MNNLLSRLPAFKNERQNIVEDHGTSDIIKEVCRSHYIYASDYDKIAADFDKGNIPDTLRALFSWCKRNLRYKEESEDIQTTRSPAAIISTGKTWGVDCKHYAGFIAGVIDALKRKGADVDWCYRFVSYDFFDSTPGHVFVVVKYRGREIYVDPVLSEMDLRYPTFYYKQDKICGMLQRVSGVGVARDLIKDNVYTLNPGTSIVPRPTTAPVVMETGADLPQKSNATLYIILGVAALVALYTFNKKRK